MPIDRLENLYRSNPEGRKAKRTAGNAVDKVRAGDQSQDRQGAGPRSTGKAARPRRGGDRIECSLLRLLAAACGTFEHGGGQKVMVGTTPFASALGIF